MPAPIATTPLAFERLDEPTMRTRAAAFLATMQRRRSVRSFAPSATRSQLPRARGDSARKGPAEPS